MGTKDIIWLSFILFLTACTIPDSNISDQKTIKIAYLPITHSAAVMMMGELSYDYDCPWQIELVRFTSWPEVVDALRTKRVDGASILFEVALRAQETDSGLAMLSLSHRGGNVVVVENSVRSYRDLIGKTIAIPHRLSPQNTLLHIALEREGIAFDQINSIEINPAEMPFSMASGTISAYIVAEPYGSVAESTGAGYILEKSDSIYPDAACCVFVFRQSVLESEEGLLDWLQDAFEKAGHNTRLKDENVMRVFKKRTSFSDTVIQNSLQNTSYENLHITQDEYEQITQTISHYGILTSVPPYDDFVWR